jgi:hypothetical protein
MFRKMFLSLVLVCLFVWSVQATEAPNNPTPSEDKEVVVPVNVPVQEPVVQSPIVIRTITDVTKKKEK